MSFTIVTWDVDTSNAARAHDIAEAVKNRLLKFGAIQLLGHCAMVRTDGNGIDAVRHALDELCGNFAGILFYLSIDPPEDDPLMEGIFPPWANLDAAHKATKNDDNPLQREPTGAPQLLGFVSNAPNRGGRKKGSK